MQTEYHRTRAGRGQGQRTCTGESVCVLVVLRDQKMQAGFVLVYDVEIEMGHSGLLGLLRNYHWPVPRSRKALEDGGPRQ